MELTDLPLHPLVVHAAIGLVLLAVLSAVVLAVVPGWRWLTRWVALVTAVAATGVVYVARLSGNALLEARPFLSSPESAVRGLLETHQDRADVLMVVVIAFTALVVLAFWLLPARSGLASGRLHHEGSTARWVRWVVPVSLVVLGAVVLLWVVLTGHAGARAVWGS